MAKGARNLHIALFPWLAFGHMPPFMELAKCLAHRGHRVSYISTPRNILRLPKPHSPLITFVEVTLPAIDGLPETAESTMDVPLHLSPLLKSALDALQDPIKRFLETESPNWIIMDFLSYWLPPIAADLGISSAFFSVYTAWFLVFSGPVKSLADGSLKREVAEDFTAIPEWVPFPSKLAFRPFEAKQVMVTAQEDPSGVSDMFRYSKTVMGCDAYLLRTCTEFEAEWLRILGEINGKRVIPVGLLPPSTEDDGGGDNHQDDAWRLISDWLDKQARGSVVYVALGSEAAPSQEQLPEMALGLEMSELPFFWLLRKPAGSVPAQLPEGFEERTKGRGLVWTGWTSQRRILNHESVGGLLTHSGWGSVIEGLQRGLPLIFVPFVWDQGINARILAEEKVGIEIPRGEQDGSLSRNSVAESLKLVMVSEEGRIIREKAHEWGKVVADRGLQDHYMDEAVEYLRNHTR